MRSDNATSRPWTTTWRGTALLAAGLVAVGTALLAWSPWNTPAPTEANDGERLAGELAHLKMLGHALRLHADEHDGRYPASIADIEWRQSQPGMDAGNLPAVASRFHPADTGKAMDWLYYAGHTETDPADTILVASPVPVGAHQDQRMVTRISNVTEVLAESEFQRQVGVLP